MSDKKCQHCKSLIENCICDAVDRFFFSTKSITRTYKIAKKRFWYINPKRISMVWTN